MAETADQIRRQILEKRERLAQDINELEVRVRQTVDWRAQIGSHMGVLLVSASVAGLLLGLMTGGRRVGPSVG